MRKRKIANWMLTLLGFVLLLSVIPALPLQNSLPLQDSLRSWSLGTSLATADGAMEWNRTYGDTGTEEAFTVIQTADGGFAFAGYTCPYGADSESCQDFWLVKTDAHGDMEWQQTYDRGFNDVAFGVIQTADGGFALAGRTASYAGGGIDAWLVKTDAHGGMEWQQTYGGDSGEGAKSVIQTADGGFALAGRTFSYGAGEDDFWLVKTDTRGNMEWQQTYGGPWKDGVHAFGKMGFIETTDGGYALVGCTNSSGANGPNGPNCEEAWLVKTDVHGNMEWAQAFGGSKDDKAYSIIKTTDGAFVFAGTTASYGSGGFDAWLVKTDVHGKLQWTKTYGGLDDECAQSVIQTTDGGFALAGSTRSYGAGGDDSWLVKADARGNIEWQQTFGGLDDERALSGIQTADGGLALAGSTASFGAGGRDAWLVKTISPDAPTVTVVSPNGGEVLQDMQTITWTATDPQGDPLTYIVYYSPDGGQTWTQLAIGFTESSYQWDTTTVVDGANYLIQVEASNGMQTCTDISNAPFEIVNEPINTVPTVLVIQPNGGERVHGMFEIQWSANDPDGDILTFTISYSPNEGQMWTQIASEVTGTSYQWDTSGVQMGENYLIKIEASDGRLTAEDRSDYKFTVEREALTEKSSKTFFVPSFRVVEALGALLVLLGLDKRRRRRKMLLEGQ